MKAISFFCFFFFQKILAMKPCWIATRKSIFHMVEHSIFKTYFERKCTISKNCTFFEIKYLNTLPGQFKKSYCFTFMLFRCHGNQGCISGRGGGTYCFWCGWCRRSFFSAFHFLNQWVDFDQTCTDALLEQGKEVIRFGLIFMVTPAF